MDHNIDFTIITPAYNAGKWIKETIESVFAVCKDLSFEYIVVNDGSTDDTARILTEYAESITVISQSNQGEAAAFNHALDIARGDYVLVVSADDPVRDARLFVEAKRILDLEHSIVCVYPDWSIIDENSNIIKNVKVEEFDKEVLIGKFKCIVGPGGIFRRGAAIQIKGRDSRYTYTSDYDFWLRLSELGSFKKISGYLAFWRQHSSSTSISHRGLQMAQERIKVMENFLQSQKGISKQTRRKAKAYSYFEAAILVYFDSDVPGRKFLIKALLNYPKGLITFDAKTMTYIVLTPFSSRILTLLKKIGLYGNLPNHA